MDTTRASLLLRVRNLQDQTSWDEFVEIYGPLILKCLVRLDIPRDDALDLVQEVLSIVMIQISTGKFQYDHKKGSFRAWLKTVTRNRASKYFKERTRLQVPRGGTENVVRVLGLPESESGEVDVFELEWRKRCYQLAAADVRPRVAERTWQAFQLSFDGVSAGEIAQRLGMTKGHVFVCKSRVVKMLREAVKEICGEDQ